MARGFESSELDPTGAGTPSRGRFCTGRAQTRRCTAFAYGYIAAVAIARRSRPTATTREASAEPSESACTDRTPTRVSHSGSSGRGSSRGGASPRAGRLTHQVVALSDVCGAAGGLRVRCAGGGHVAGELVEVAADRMPPMAVAEHLAQPVGLAQPSGGTVHVADGDRPPEHRGRLLAHRVVAEGDQVVVPGEDLGPVGLLGARRVVVQGGDGRLDLVAAGGTVVRLRGQRRLQNVHALGDLARVPQAAVLPVQ